MGVIPKTIRLVPQLTKSGADATILPGTDDLTQKVKTTLGQHLKSLQTDAIEGNRYQDDDVFANPQMLAKHDVGKFFNNLEPAELNTLKGALENALRSDISATEILQAIQGTPIDKHGNGPGTPAETDKNAETVLKATSAVLRMNRFSQETPFSSASGVSDTFAHMPSEFGTSAQGAPVSFEELNKVGLSLMLRATGEFIEGDPTLPKNSLATLLPGQAQLGIRIDADSMYAGDVPGAPGVSQGVKGRRSKIGGLLLGQNRPSYGVLNSPNEPFNGFAPIGMTALAIVLIIALKLSFSLMLSLLSLMMRNKGPAQRNKSTLGKYRPQRNQAGAFITLADIGIIHVNNDFTKAAKVGLETFFGWDGLSFRRVVKSPGFYANFVRVIIQSGGTIIQSIVDAGKLMATGNVIAGAQAFLGLVDILRSSKIIAFLNIIAQIGDRVIESQGGASPLPFGGKSPPNPWDVDKLITNPRTRVMKSRVGLGRGLAWRQGSVPSALILPANIATAAKNLNKDITNLGARHTSMMGTPLATRRDAPNLISSRLTADEVKMIEAELDSEYVPFYFQDLRTNEFIGFPAFIAGYGESFAPTYSSISPMGRIDPVMHYSNTTRVCNLSFHVVATNRNDFDEMYMKLNKLVTLVYPQWTAGNSVVDADRRKFIQPFSQVPSASPLIRLRLGDLLRTNFSNMSLARLFGVDKNDFLQSPALAPAAEEKLSNAIKEKADLVELLGWRPGDKALISSGYFEEIKSYYSRKISPTWSREIEIGIPDFPDDDIIYYKFKFVEDPAGENYTIAINQIEIDIEQLRSALSLPPSNIPTESDVDKFFDFGKGENNAIVRSFRNTQGKGAAGFITTLNMGWDEGAGKWETDFGARAPSVCKIDLGMTIIHDIAPGIDSDGYNRAPIYTVGRAVRALTGDAYDSTGEGSNTFKKYGKI